MDYTNEYRSKLGTPEAAAALVKSGDWVEYVTGTVFASLCDEALSRRRDELTDVKLRGQILYGPIRAVECDPEHAHFTYDTWHCSAYERQLCDRGMAFYTPMLFRNLAGYYRDYLRVDVAFVCARPMDRHGYFNLSLASGISRQLIGRAGAVVIEVNENLPKIYGGYTESIHISDVTMVVEGPHGPVPTVPPRPPAETDVRIAQNVLPHIPDGATLQLGIGGMPGALGEMLAQSDLRDLGMHTELCTDGFLHLYEAGKLTNRRKALFPGKGVFGLASGSRELYDWLDDNPGVLSMPIDYVNDPAVIASMDNFISLNSCIAVDLYGQVSSESAGLRQISGTGGQVDFLTGAVRSRGGKAFLCLASTHTDRNGAVHSNIVPHFEGDIITSPRSQAFYIATENGVANLAGRSTWERAELLISLADPRFRGELERAAQDAHIWRRSCRR